MNKTLKEKQIESQRKLLDIPVSIISILAAKAKDERRSVKSLMETIIIDAAQKIENKYGK